MPFGFLVASQSPRGLSLRPVALALCLAITTPAQAGWFSSKAEPAPAPAAAAPASQPIGVMEAAGTSASAPIPANLDQFPDAPGNSALDLSGADPEANADELSENLADGDTATPAEEDEETADQAVVDDDTAPDDDIVLLPNVEESDLDDSSTPAGQYSDEELAALGNLWDRLRKGAGMDTSHDHERIEIQRSWYLRNNDYLDRMSRRATRYLYYTISEAEKRNLPTELALLPVIESAYDPFAYSHANAAGMWQFIPGTATFMGVKQNAWFDGRRDVIESTRAAYDFLSLLYRKFGDWQLVLASYNAGPGAVQRAIDRNRAAGLPTDFWSLRLPAETRDYVPRFLAIAQIVKTPEAYGATLRPVLNQPYFRIIDVRSQVDMPQAASIAGVSLKEFYQLNPGFKRQSTDPEGPHRLLVPAALPLDYEADIAALPVPETVVAQSYKVKKGDTLFGVARKFDLTPAALRELNGLTSDRLALGRTLTIARGNLSPEYVKLRQEMKLDRSALAPRQIVRSKIYKVRRGDTLASVARRHGTSVKTLARLNRISTRAKLRAGQMLTVKQVKSSSRSVAAAKGKKGQRKITHTVRKGDTLSSISRRYKVPVSDLKRWNRKSSTLIPGKGLVIYVTPRRKRN
ncbi:MAG: hypothetical protein K0Q68_1008 [Moraxellaceae bacterium]|jgi:membrane-bound lytic murein transglycosylase D|nr:hypothetical protein [Moraxellaceae bacterium]